MEHFTKLVTEVFGKYLLRSISAALRDNLSVGFIVTQKILPEAKYANNTNASK